MAFTESGIADLRISEYDGGVVVAARNTHSDKVVQGYVSGRLVGVQPSVSEAVRFHFVGVTETDAIRLLAVDPAQAGVNHWLAAFGSTGAARIFVQTPQTIAPYRPSCRWRVYRGDAGDSSASVKIWDQLFYPGGRRCGGFGCCFGRGGFGWDGFDCMGWGYNFGRGEFGFDCDLLQWETETLQGGTYPVKVTVVDEAGNESPPSQTTVQVDACARAASALAVNTYTQATDTLVLSFTPSEDLPS